MDIKWTSKMIQLHKKLFVFNLLLQFAIQITYNKYSILRNISSSINFGIYYVYASGESICVPSFNIIVVIE